MVGDLSLTWKDKRIRQIQWKIHLAEQWVEVTWRTWAVLCTTGEEESVPLWRSFQTSGRALASSQPSYPEDQCPKQQRGTCSTDRCKVSRELPKTGTFLQKLSGTVRNLNILPLRAPPQQLRGCRVCPACWLLPTLGLVPAFRAGLCFAKPSCPKWWHQQWPNLTCLLGLCCRQRVCSGETKAQPEHKRNRVNMTAIWQTLS